MTTTTFSNGVTLTDADWFNDVDDTAYGSVLPPAHNSTAIWSGGNGSAGSVGIGFSSDPDTGMYRAAANELGIATAGAERMRVDADGNVGIGSTSPTYKLVVSNAGANGVEIDPEFGLIQTYNRDTSAYTASLHYALTHQFFAGSSPAEHMRIDSNGYALIGYTSSNGAYRLQVNSQIFATNATIATSDERYKQNIQPITGALGIVAALRPVSFRWKSHPIHDFDLGSEQLGFIAQEVGVALGNAGFKDGIVKSNRVVAARGDRGVRGVELAEDVDEEFLGLAEGKIVPILAAAIKELKAIVDAQAVRIAALEAR